MTIRAKLLATYIGLTVVGVALVSLFSSWQITYYLDRRTNEHLRSQLDALASLFDEGLLQADSLGLRDGTLRRMARSLGLRLTLIRADGAVVFDSEIPRDALGKVENHLHRPEIEEARRGRIGMNKRRSATVEEEYLYAAEAVHRTTLHGTDTVYVRTALRYDDIRMLDEQIQAVIWGIGALSIAVVMVVSVQVSRRISRPILSIAKTARSIRDGDLSLRIPVGSRDEIGTLSSAINDMAEKLGNDIAQLKKLERVRSEFLGNVSHELRTPIFSLQGFLETLLDGAIDDPNVNRDFLEKAHRHASRLNALLSDLIEISRIESGEMKMSFRYIPIDEVLRESTNEMHTVGVKKDILLTKDSSAAQDDKVYADRERLKQVMVNLIDNAIKYTEPGGRITCTARREGSMVAVDVSDTGIGIPAEHLPRIFERFYRVGRDRSRDVGGTGLGLAIVKHIVEAHGGTLRVASVPGEGSTFTFTLKRA